MSTQRGETTSLYSEIVQSNDCEVLSGPISKDSGEVTGPCHWIRIIHGDYRSSRGQGVDDPDFVFIGVHLNV